MGILRRIANRLPVVGRPESSRPAAGYRPQPRAWEPPPPPPPRDPEEVRSSIERDVQQHPVVLFMKGTRAAPQCGFSAAAAGIFEELGVPFETRDVLADPVLRQGIKDFSDWPTLPQAYVGSEFIGGSDIITELHGSGELKRLVDAAVATAAS